MGSRGEERRYPAGVDTITVRFTGPDDDLRYKALDRKTDVEVAIREYPQWEVDLVSATESDPDFGFRRFAPALVRSAPTG